MTIANACPAPGPPSDPARRRSSAPRSPRPSCAAPAARPRPPPRSARPPPRPGRPPPHGGRRAVTTTSSATSSATATATIPALPGAGKPAVTIGDKNYTEQFVLGQLYLQALKAQGFTVTINQNIGPTEVTRQALKTGALAMYPEYLDVFDSAMAGYRHGFRSRRDAYRAAVRYANGQGLVLLHTTPFSDTDAIAVTVAFAAENHLRSVFDLRRVGGTLTMGGAAQLGQLAPGPADARVGLRRDPGRVQGAPGRRAVRAAGRRDDPGRLRQQHRRAAGQRRLPAAGRPPAHLRLGQRRPGRVGRAAGPGGPRVRRDRSSASTPR